MKRILCTCVLCVLGASACGLQDVNSQIDMRKAEQAMVNRDFATAAQAYAGSAQSMGMAGEAGSPVAQYWLGTFLHNGAGVPMDRAAAMQWMKAAAAADYPPALLALGLWQISGQGAPADPAAGARLVARAAEHALPEGVMILGALTAQGVGVPRDASQALALFTKARSLGYPVPAEFLTPQGVARLAAIK